MNAIDLCTVDELTAYLPVGSTLNQSVAERLITAASEAIMRVADREFATADATIVEGISDAPDEVERSEVARRFPLDPWRASRVVPVGDMAATPARVDFLDADFTAVTEDISDALYELDPFNRSTGEPITALRFTRGAIPAAAAWIEVTAEWGWPTVPVDIRQACIVQVREWYVRDVQNFATQFADDAGLGGNIMPRELSMAARDAARAYRYLMVR